MANPAQNPSNSEDDSWGKIASDLFGIQFNEDDNDFEFPDEDAPKKAPPVAEKPATAHEELVTEQQPEISEGQVTEEPAKKSIPGNEDQDEFWDILESWNWDEATGDSAKKESGKSRASGESRASDSRRASGDRPPARRSRSEDSSRDDSPRREERRPERSERPRRREEAVESGAASDEVSRSDRSRRPSSDRPGRSEQPRPPRRSEQGRPASERKPERPRSRESTDESFEDNEFGAGVAESKESPRPFKGPVQKPREESHSVRKPIRAKRQDESDDFEGDLFSEDLEEEVIADQFVDDEIDADEPVSESDDDQEDRPRRRRRRRRRGRGRSGTQGASQLQGDPDLEDTAEYDVPAAEFESDDESAEADREDESDEIDEDREARRPRRRRRRRGRRSDSAKSVDRDLEEPVSESDEDDEEGEELVVDERGVMEDDPNEEAVVPVNYEGIPTWAEAISYLVITPPNESRGHHRGRGDARKR